MRRTVSFLLAATLLSATTPALALTQEEILQRRLEKMKQAESSIRVEEQQRQEQIREATSGVDASSSSQTVETLSIPEPVRQPHPEPKTGLFGRNSQPTAAAPPASASQPAAAPASVSQPAAAPASAPPAAKAGGSDPAKASALAASAAKAAAAGNAKAALALLDEAIAADPEDPDLRNNRGNLLSNAGKPREALADYDRAIAAKTSEPSFFTNRGLAHERLGNRDKACSDYKKACDLGDCDFFKSYKAEGNCR